MNEQMITKKPETKPKQEQEGPKVVRGYAEGTVSKDFSLETDAHDLAQEAILREQEIAKYQREISGYGESEAEEASQEEAPQNLDEKESPTSPKSETETRLSGLGWSEDFINNKKKEFETMSPGPLYNEVQELSIQGMINFIRTRKEAGAGILFNKLNSIKEEINKIKSNGDTIKPFKELMTNANEPNSSLLMEDLNKVLRNSGYKGKVLGIFGKNESVDSFQNDITAVLLGEEQRAIFEKVKKEIEKNGMKYEKSTKTRTAISQGATQTQREYGKNGITAKIEDVIKEIK